MKHNAKDNFRLAIDELCSCQNHLNNAYMNVKEEENKTEVHAALKTVASAIEHAQSNYNNYED
ncbi:hypothetical protein ACSXBA_08450 [Clostridium perfringens]|uniref:hypothetical protein n=1 Tax=Clostridium perfringens TaxID=1502 RepID=UPI000992B7E6|nr:hypothetical protein [Clostridium perfringens]AQW23750.1 hypothetical protein BXT91_07435 [Clostridium perfringens]EHK2338169.1 hypothetical protein [Clostridium perfringens]EIF5084085.1 hypothetical protein [Clostridium perfringens]HAT4249273.1 hypothetical protein [Clostridium perfringens]HDI3014197.1 hypothetical protein [Clostridium perfringens]